VGFNRESRGGDLNVPRFLDFELDEQQRSSLLQAWMYSYPSDSSPAAHGAARLHSSHLHGGSAGFVASVNLICTSGSETPVAVDDTVNLIFGSEQNYLMVYYGQATANVTSAFVCPDDVRPVPFLSQPEAESAFIENERVISFRPNSPDVRRAHQMTNLSLSPDAARFAARARGRRLRVEEDSELQSE